MIKICIFGRGKIGKIIEKCLDYSVVELVSFLDNGEFGPDEGNVPVIKPECINTMDVDYILVSSVRYQSEMNNQLIELGVPKEKIISAYFEEEDMPLLMDIFTSKGVSYIFYSKNQRHTESKIKELFDYIRKRNTNLYLKKYSEQKAAEYIYEKFVMDEEVSRSVIFESRKEYYDYLLTKMSDKDGLFLEFGVFKGDSINYIAKRIYGKKIYGFDSFEGLPEGWLPGYQTGKFDLGGELPLVEDNVVLFKGWFDNTLPSFVNEHRNENCAYINIDCDLYSSTKFVLNQLKNNIGKGTIISFDEYVGQIGWELDEYKAFQEWIDENGMKYRYIACAFGGGHQLTVRTAVEIL